MATANLKPLNKSTSRNSDTKNQLRAHISILIWSLPTSFPSTRRRWALLSNPGPLFEQKTRKVNGSSSHGAALFSSLCLFLFDQSKEVSRLTSSFPRCWPGPCRQVIVLFCSDGEIRNSVENCADARQPREKKSVFTPPRQRHISWMFSNPGKLIPTKSRLKNRCISRHNMFV